MLSIKTWGLSRRMYWDSTFDFLAGILQKPTIWAEPGLVIAQHMPVIIWCQGSWEAQEYYMHKEGSIDPWDKQFPLEQKNKAKFHIDKMSKDFAGIYKCYYKSPAGLSEHSDTLVLVLTGEWRQRGANKSLASGVQLSRGASLRAQT